MTKISKSILSAMGLQPPCAILPALIPVPHITSVKRMNTFNYFGPVQTSIATEASKFLATVTDGVEPEVASAIESFVFPTHNDCIGEADQKNACWFTVRVTQPLDEFEVPRWHQDGRMFPFDEGREEIVRSKYALTMLGPTTLMLQPDAHVFTTYREGQFKHFWWEQTSTEHTPTEEEEERADDDLRHWLAEEFEGADQVPVRNGEIVRFSWGRDDSPVHSEPDLTSDRVFMTVLYGSEAELHGMCEWRNAKYGDFDF